MEGNVNEKQTGLKVEYLVIGITVIVIIAIAIVLILFNKEDKTENLYETEQVTAYTNKIEKTLEEVKEMELEEAKTYVVSKIYETNEEYSGLDEIDYISNKVLVKSMTDTSTNVEEFITNVTEEIRNTKEEITEGIEKILNGNDSSVLKTSITLKSNTVCEDEAIDNKYCVDKLNARVYIKDVTSNKWAVIIHGYMMSGSLMYNAIGNMYTEQGYNVIAPDLRGFGSSDGSVAMGYLESLDVYDWIKDLNQNWNQKERYGVTVAPETIVVHGVSLGGATTLQLATNPDIQAASKAPYTSNLTDLHVKGFVDDCGYTSMSGIITEMLTAGNTVELTSIPSSVNIDLDDFMKEMSNVAKQESIPGFEVFENIDLENIDFSTIYSNINQFTNTFNDIQNNINQYINSNGSIEIPGMNQDTINNILKDYTEYVDNEEVKNKVEDIIEDAMENINIPNIPSIPNIPNIFPGIGKANEATTNNIVKVSNTTTNNNSLEGLVADALMNLVGVGLTEENYAKYSNVFSEGRKFVSGSKVMIIHGTLDTTVPHSNANTVEKNVAPGILTHKWDAQNQPHAFIVIGLNKEQYKNKVASYVRCVEDTTCTLF